MLGFGKNYELFVRLTEPSQEGSEASAGCYRLTWVGLPGPGHLQRELTLSFW